MILILTVNGVHRYCNVLVMNISKHISNRQSFRFRMKREHKTWLPIFRIGTPQDCGHLPNSTYSNLTEIDTLSFPEFSRGTHSTNISVSDRNIIILNTHNSRDSNLVSLHCYLLGLFQFQALPEVIGSLSFGYHFPDSVLELSLGPPG